MFLTIFHLSECFWLHLWILIYVANGKSYSRLTGRSSKSLVCCMDCDDGCPLELLRHHVKKLYNQFFHHNKTSRKSLRVVKVLTSRRSGSSQRETSSTCSPREQHTSYILCRVALVLYNGCSKPAPGSC